MQNANIWLIAKLLFKRKLKNKGVLLLLLLFIVTQIFVTISGWKAYQTQKQIRTHHQEISRKSWESNPDKHPHRMSHFGSFAFRLQHPLSIFDSGLENYTGNAIFLEAHKQNTANFSEASFSTGLVRFGDLNLAMLLSLILPLIVFFIGYDVISREKEHQTLKIMKLQGAKMNEIILGKILGIFLWVILFFAPSFIALCSMLYLEQSNLGQELLPRILIIICSYIVFFIILSFLTVFVSAKSKSSNQSLLRLLGFWLLFFVVIPKTAQVVGNYLYPNPTKLVFKSTIENEMQKIGNSHNPDDPYFQSIKDSVLKANNVEDVSELSFNYGGYVMIKGEKITSDIFVNHQQNLIETYKKQNGFVDILVILNPYLAIKNISMSFSGTDFATYNSFLIQAEAFRYKQSQFMNDLQMKYISNKAKGSEGKIHVVDKDYWKNAPKFRYTYLNVSKNIKKQALSIISLVLWFVVLIVLVRKFKN